MKADSIIVGGGMVGLTTALLFAKKGFTVALIEPNSSNVTITTDFDLRCSALSKRSQEVLATLGVWDKLDRVSPYEQMVVWDGAAEIRFSAKEIEQPNLGYIVENHVLLKALWQQVHSEPLITHYREKVQALVVTDQEATLSLASGNVLKTPLVIGADGKHSWVRHNQGIDCDQKDYQQTALVTTVRTTQPHHYTAWQRFLPEGPIAFLPLSDPYYSSIVWTRRSQDIPDSFHDTLAQALEYRLGEVVWSGELQAFPLVRQQAKSYIKPHVALVGDAAHVVHPFVGQGVNFGIYGAVSLSETAQPGHYLSLRQYERNHKSFMHSMMLGLEGLMGFWQARSPLCQDLKTVGVRTVNSIPLIKRFLIKQAMGIA